ncbi:MAG: hypothetical protein ABSG59_02425 [Verrucomicrobiota bacterium]|jgi:hypothetical protein
MVPKPEKSSEKSLTGSRKTRRKAKAFDALDALDAVNEHCRTITTLAALLEASGECLAPEVAADAGSLIAEEAWQLKALLKTAWKKMPR